MRQLSIFVSITFDINEAGGHLKGVGIQSPALGKMIVPITIF